MIIWFGPPVVVMRRMAIAILSKTSWFPDPIDKGTDGGPTRSQKPRRLEHGTISPARNLQFPGICRAGG
eukprot:14731053-Heterocapsa_arctica.AAC.1